MSSPIISVENLSKSYTISHQTGSNGQARGYLRLSEELLAYPRKFLSSLMPNAHCRSSETEEFWALQDVSFEVLPGEVVGIIGGNGAGKSTLLKVLSRITEPTRGKICLRGRVASLLEVGTGFHPELSGRENVFLNGAVLGMSQSEVRKKFDEIVEFAEVERFLDTPVKRYSSGMYVRLAFAVAAHLDPEILVVDEVLAVGDAKFQKKCLGKMQDVSRKQGRTVLFVSHNMAAVKSLCTRAIGLERGKIVADDKPEPVLQRYYQSGDTNILDGHIPAARARQLGTGEVQFTRVNLIDEHRAQVSVIQTGNELQFVICFSVRKPVEPFFLEIGMTDYEGRQLTQSRFPRHTQPGLELNVGDYEIRVILDINLFPGSYSVLLGAHRINGTTIDWLERCLDFEVLNSPFESPNHHPWATRGFMRPDEDWTELIALSSDAERVGQ